MNLYERKHHTESHYKPTEARRIAIDISPTQKQLARERMAERDNNYAHYGRYSWNGKTFSLMK